MAWGKCLKTMVAAGLGAAMSIGCLRSVRNPIGTSLADLAGESRRYDSRAVDYTELFAVNGGIMLPVTGTLAYYPVGGKTPAYMIGITNTIKQPTSRITMRSTASLKADDVLAVKTALEAAQDAATAAASAQLELASFRARQADGKQKLAEQVFTDAVTVLNARITAAEVKLQENIAKVRLAANKPGIVIARWRSGEDSGVSGNLGGMFGGAASMKRNTVGFVVLGNVQASMLIFGEDVRTYVKAMEEAEKPMFGLLGIMSYILGAEHVAYTSSLNVEEAISASLDVSIKDLASSAKFLASIDRIKISSYYAAIASLENSGMVGPVEWEVKETPMLTYRPLSPNELAQYGLNPDSQTLGRQWTHVVNQKIEEMADIPGVKYQVVYAVPARAPRVFKAWQDDRRLEVVKKGERWFALVDLELRSQSVRHKAVSN